MSVPELQALFHWWAYGRSTKPPPADSGLGRILAMDTAERARMAAMAACGPKTLHRLWSEWFCSRNLALKLLAVTEPLPPEILEDRANSVRLELSEIVKGE